MVFDPHIFDVIKQNELELAIDFYLQQISISAAPFAHGTQLYKMFPLVENKMAPHRISTFTIYEEDLLDNVWWQLTSR